MLPIGKLWYYLIMDKLLLFSLTSNKKLAKEVADILKIKLGKVSIEHFADGEVMVRSLENVRGKSIYIIQSTVNPVNERLMELLLFIDSLRNGFAKEITLVIPYMGYARQDRMAKIGEPISARLVADLFNVVGVDHMITIDLHTPQIQGFFDCPVDALSSIPLFANYYRTYLKERKISTRDIVVVSPDHGSAHRARDLASYLPFSSIAIIDKRRPSMNKAEVISVVGDVKNKYAIIIDDIIDTAGTIDAAYKALLKDGAKEIMVAATHGLFSKNALEILNKEKFSDIVISNSIERKEKNNVYHVLSIGPLVAEVISKSEKGEPLDEKNLAFF